VLAFIDHIDRFPNLLSDGKLLHPYATYLYHALQLILAYNIAGATWPLFRGQDDLCDIPLTPAQRKLLGLPPSSKPPTPGSQYITPPRYARTPTPLGGSPSSNANSPISGSPSQKQNGGSGSPFSPGTASYLQKALGGNSLNGSRRHSYGSPSPLGPNLSRIGVPETPDFIYRLLPDDVRIMY
jgi:nucleoporin POM34